MQVGQHKGQNTVPTVRDDWLYQSHLASQAQEQRAYMLSLFRCVQGLFWALTILEKGS